MLLEVKYKTGTRNKNKPGRILVLRCDACQIIFERPFSQKLYCQEFHAHSRPCHGKLERSGAPHDLKKRQTSFEHYGVDHPRKSPVVEDIRKQTCIERYGVEHPLQVAEIFDRVTQTNLKRYGVKNVFQAEQFKEKSKQTMFEHYGVEHALQSKIIFDKIDWSAAWKKAHETKKLNGSYIKSKAEDVFFEKLSSMFAEVERQIPIYYENCKWLIDFKINNLFIQFDGIYWHGLDRHIEIIRNSLGDRDRSIANHYDNDRYQDFWFATNNMKLIRVTDHQAKTMSNIELYRLLTS